MHVVRLSRILKLCCLILLCIGLTGCLSVFGPGGCGHPPEVDGPEILVIDQRENYFYPEFGEKICYDGAAVYYLHSVENGMQLCRIEPQREPTVLYTFDRAVYEIACWKDMLLVYGELPEQDGEKQQKATYEENRGIYIFQKDDPATDPIIIITGKEQRRQVVVDGVPKDMEFERFPLRAVFNEETENKSFACLMEARYPQWVAERDSNEKQKTLLALFGISLEKEYNVSSVYLSLNQIWMLDQGSFAIYGQYKDGLFDVFSYCRLDSEARKGNTPYGAANGNLFFYQGMPYAVESSSHYVGINPCVELGKNTYTVEYNGDEAFIKRFSGAEGRLQYLVIPKYKVAWGDRYDAGYIASHKIIALDLDTMQQTKELALTTPREQVLYVSEAGAYTWRHDESRIFLTNWEGQSKPVSDTIPYTPRYETDEDRAQNDACNTWYVEVDPECSRLLLFDMDIGGNGAARCCACRIILAAWERVIHNGKVFGKDKAQISARIPARGGVFTEPTGHYAESDRLLGSCSGQGYLQRTLYQWEHF